MKEILNLLENDGRLTPESIARMLDKETGDIKNMIESFEENGIIELDPRSHKKFKNELIDYEKHKNY